MTHKCILVAVLLASAGLAVAEDLPESSDGVAIIVAKNTPAPRSTMVTVNHRVYVRVGTGAVAIRSNSVKRTVEKLKSRDNNVYSLAVNTEGIARATEAVKVSGRVYLRSPGSVAPKTPTKTHLAKK